MRIALHNKLFALAALASLAFGAPVLAEAAGGQDEPHKAGTPSNVAPSKLYVKDGDHFREANEAELKVAASSHDGHGGGGGLSFTGIHRWDLGVYTLIVFAILLFVLAKFAWPNIRAGLEKRETTIRGAIEESRRDRTEAAEQLARAKKELNETAAKVAAMFEQARKEAESLKAAKLEEGERDAAATRERANREAQAKKDADLKDVQQQAVELAVLIATKALRQQVSIENQHKLLDESIAELNAGAGASKA
jgi:F-type H+-transporting ATPase subunit b